MKELSDILWFVSFFVWVVSFISYAWVLVRAVKQKSEAGHFGLVALMCAALLGMHFLK